MELKTDYLEAIAAALEEDMLLLLHGTSRRLPDCTKRQALLYFLSEDVGIKVAGLASLTGKGYSTIQNVLETATGYYESGDEQFFTYYQAVRDASIAWLQNQPEEA